MSLEEQQQQQLPREDEIYQVTIKLDLTSDEMTVGSKHRGWLRLGLGGSETDLTSAGVCVVEETWNYYYSMAIATFF